MQCICSFCFCLSGNVKENAAVYKKINEGLGGIREMRFYFYREIYLL